MAVLQTLTRSEATGSANGVVHKLAVAGSVLALLLAAMDATVMGTVLPTVMGEIGNASSGGYAWLVSVFMLAQVAGIPVAGWVSDRVNDRVVAVAASVLFLAASLLAGAAGSFGLLVLARAVHGLSAGAIVVSCYVIVGRLYGPQQRASVQGLLSTVWGVAAVLGPVIGAVINAAWGWRWVFFINVPLCAAVIAVVLFALPNRPAGPPSPGARGPAHNTFPTTEYVLIVGGASLILLGLQAGTLGLGRAIGTCAAVIGLVLIALVRRYGGALTPTEALAATPSGVAAITTVGACVIMYATVTVLPIRLAAHGAGTTAIAIIVGIAAFGWVLSSGITGVLLARRGYRFPMTAGGLLLLVSAACSAIGTLPWLSGATAGLGTGAVTAAALALLQDQTPPSQLGVATSAAQMLRNLGSAVGINGIAALSAAVSSATAENDPAFWLLVGVATFAVAIPARFAPKQRSNVT